jgi:hypothetical protein
MRLCYQINTSSKSSPFQLKPRLLPAAGASLWRLSSSVIFRAMDPLRATIEEFAAEGFTHVACYCPRCRMMRLRPISWLPRISLGLTIAQLSARLRCAECGGQLRSVKPWRLEDLIGKPLGRRGITHVQRLTALSGALALAWAISPYGQASERNRTDLRP